MILAEKGPIRLALGDTYKACILDCSCAPIQLQCFSHINELNFNRGSHATHIDNGSVSLFLDPLTVEQDRLLKLLSKVFLCAFCMFQFRFSFMSTRPIENKDFNTLDQTTYR